MSTTSLAAVAAPLRGHLHQHEDGTLDGWCWAPDRPGERLVVEILVEDRVAVSMVAAMFRGDVLAQGCGDGCHGFAVRLPPDLRARGECLITARERRSRRVFGRALRSFPGERPVVSRLDAVETIVAEMAQGTAGLRAGQARPLASDAVRTACGGLASVLAARAGVRLRAARPLTLPRASVTPALGIVLPVPDALLALRCLADLAPVLAAIDAEVLALDAGEDPESALVPMRVRHLRYVRDAAAAAPGVALALGAAGLRARRLVLLGTAAPSGAALLALARALHARPPGGVVPADEAARAWPLPARLGLVAGIDRALWTEVVPPGLDLPGTPAAAAAEIALRLRLLGHSVIAVREPPEGARPDGD